MTLEDQSDVEQANGSCEGPDSMYVKLVSSDGHEFILKREYALISPTIAAMLSGPGEFNETETNKIRLLAISSHILQKVCAYLVYKAHYANGNPDGPVPGFPIEPEIALDLLMASCFLEC